MTLGLDLVAENAVVRLEEFLGEKRLYCDVLVNSAGFGLRGAAISLPIADQLDMIDLNVRALTELTLHFLPGMVRRGRGGVINFSSVAGFLPGPQWPCTMRARASFACFRSLFTRNCAAAASPSHALRRDRFGRTSWNGPAPGGRHSFAYYPRPTRRWLPSARGAVSSPAIVWLYQALLPS